MYRPLMRRYGIPSLAAHYRPMPTLQQTHLIIGKPKMLSYPDRDRRPDRNSGRTRTLIFRSGFPVRVGSAFSGFRSRWFSRPKFTKSGWISGPSRVLIFPQKTVREGSRRPYSQTHRSEDNQLNRYHRKSEKRGPKIEGHIFTRTKPIEILANA